MELLRAHGAAMSYFDGVASQIRADQWAAPTPCSAWSVRDLLNHLVVEQLWVPPLLSGATIAEVGDQFDGDQLGTDPLGRWSTAAHAARRVWTAPGAVDREVELTVGRTPASEYCWQMTLDLAVHGWDMARAIGADENFGDDLADVLLAQFAEEIPKWIGAGFFAPPVPVPPDAGPKAKLIALVGRQPA
jgi:uncharacterized protein (TIGR03086 family)